MSKRSADLLLSDILEAVGKIERYTHGMTVEVFSKDEKSVDAVVRNLEVIGEAAHRLPDDFKAKEPAIEWKKIIGLRHRIVHDYFGVDLKIIWQIITTDLPGFKGALTKMSERVRAFPGPETVR